MCGRFVRHSSMDLIEKTFNVDATGIDAVPNYNVAPTQLVLGLTDDQDNRLQQFHWGLVPFWAKDKSIGARMINARSETVAEKPSFRNAFKKRRCLIIADGYYEWKGPKGQKQPYYFSLGNHEPFGFAGLWEIWKDPEAGEYRSCTIITTEASDMIKDVHNRMPVILIPDVHDTWLDSDNQDVELLQKILAEYYYRDLRRIPVTRNVNNVRNNDPQNILPIDEV